MASGMWLLPGLRVDDAMAGDQIDVWDVGLPDAVKGEIVRLKPVADVPCVRITLASGAAVECSTSTPVTGHDGEVRRAPDALGMRLGALHGDEPLVWERVVAVEGIGLRTVYHLYANDVCYAAGVDPQHRVMTHNIYYKP